MGFGIRGLGFRLEEGLGYDTAQLQTGTLDVSLTYYSSQLAGAPRPRNLHPRLQIEFSRNFL